MSYTLKGEKGDWEVVIGLEVHAQVISAAKLFFTFGMGGNLIFPWYAGASIVLFAGPPRIATNVLEMIDRFKPTILYNAPTGYAATMAMPDFSQKYDLSSLRLCVSAGESLPAPVWQAWKEKTGLDIIDGIGSTENYHIFLSNRPGDVRYGTSGKAVPGYTLRIVDENSADVAPGQQGELLVSGPTSASQYWNNRERSRSTFLGAWTRSGDKYTQNEQGYYVYAGRTDDMLKVSGMYVSPIEVESALITHQAVLEAAVVGKEDEQKLVKPLAFVVLKTGAQGSEQLAEELRQHVKERLAPYKYPRWIEFVADLPKTATGKIQRFKLRELAARR